MILLDELEGVSFLKDLKPEHLRQIALAAQPREYPPQEVLFHEGESAENLYLVLQGTVAIEVEVPGRGNVQVQVVGPGEFLGWSPVLGPGPMTATARTRTRCRLAVLCGGRMRMLSEDDPEFGIEFLRRAAAALARRLQATRRLLAEIARKRRRGGKKDAAGIAPQMCDEESGESPAARRSGRRAK